MSVCFGTTSGNYKVGTRQRPTTSNNTNSRLLFVFSLMSMPAARLEELYLCLYQVFSDES